uniref:General transcription factor IIE subunit 1-like n=1 Tax=Callorhinchus milii TaxID=7868 RepID=A0A4W3J153_CALMI
MGDQEVITEVPVALKRLAKYVVRGFYRVEYSLTLDLLIRYPCVKEEDLQLLLKFEKKQLRTILNTLKSDKLIKSRTQVERSADGKSFRHNYYYINYKLLVDVVKYKLDHIRRKIEADERNSSTRLSFNCPSCSSIFSDLEVNHLFDPYTGNLNCTYCQTEVEESSVLTERDAQTLLAIFNEQIEPIYALLHETENITIPYVLLEPQPMEIPELSQNQKSYSFVNFNGSVEKWSTKASIYGDMYVENVDINVQDPETKKIKNPIKEQLKWMTENIVEEHNLGAMSKQIVIEMPETLDRNANSKSDSFNNEVIKTLLVHEKKVSFEAVSTSNANRSEADSDTSASEEETKNAKLGSNLDLEEEEYQFEENDPTVFIAGKSHLYSEVSQNPDLVSLMNDEERESYIHIGQEMFQAI